MQEFGSRVSRAMDFRLSPSETNAFVCILEGDGKPTRETRRTGSKREGAQLRPLSSAFVGHPVLFLSSKFDSGAEIQWIPMHLPILDLDTQNSLDEFCIRGARFLFLIECSDSPPADIRCQRKNWSSWEKSCAVKGNCRRPRTRSNIRRVFGLFWGANCRASRFLEM